MNAAGTCEHLVEGLARVILPSFAAAANGVHFINEHNAGGFLLCSLRQTIPNVIVSQWFASLPMEQSAATSSAGDVLHDMPASQAQTINNQQSTTT